MITIDHLTIRRGGTTLLDNASWRCGSGQLVGLVGLNGTGKSTLFRCLAGVRRPDSGIAFADAPSLHVGPDALNGSHTPLRHLRWIASLTSAEPATARAAIERFGLGDVARHPIRRLSLGMRQRVAIAGAFIGDPATILLDEPHNGLDIAALIDLRATLREEVATGTTIIVASHNFDELRRIADSVVAIHCGQLCELPVDDLETAFLSLTAMVGSPVPTSPPSIKEYACH